MKTDQSEHDTLAFRLSAILLKLNLGDSFDRQTLAAEFQVSERTIYRDLNRLAGIVDRLPDGRYQLAAEYRGKLQPKDLQTFARLTGVSQLFPHASHRFLVALLDTLSHSSFLVKGQNYEQISPGDSLLLQLDQAISQQRICLLTYSDKRRTLEPYRLVNSRGIWYLAATEAQKLKTFTLSRISQLNVTEQGFTPLPHIQQEIDHEDDVWFNRDKTEVLVSVTAQIAYYFQRRKLLPQQEIVKQLENGGLIVSSQISHAEQILPLLRYWIPRVRIIEPAWLKQQLENELRLYLQ